MSNPFFDHPILHSPYERPSVHWELDDEGRPTQQKIFERRKAKFITPIPKPKKRKKSDSQEVMIFDQAMGFRPSSSSKIRPRSSMRSEATWKPGGNSPPRICGRSPRKPKGCSLLHNATHRLLYAKFRYPGEPPPLHLFGQIKRVTKQWLDTCLECKGNTYPALLMYQELTDQACERITVGITRQFEGDRPTRPRSKYVRFNTSRMDRWGTKWPPPKSHINWFAAMR